MNQNSFLLLLFLSTDVSALQSTVREFLSLNIFSLHDYHGKRNYQDYLITILSQYL